MDGRERKGKGEGFGGHNSAIFAQNPVILPLHPCELLWYGRVNKFPWWQVGVSGPVPLVVRVAPWATCDGAGVGLWASCSL